MAFKPLRLNMTEPLLQRSGLSALDPPARNPLAENIDILRATQHRVVLLEAAAKANEAELQSARQDVESLQVGHFMSFLLMFLTARISHIAEVRHRTCSVTKQHGHAALHVCVS